MRMSEWPLEDPATRQPRTLVAPAHPLIACSCCCHARFFAGGCSCNPSGPPKGKGTRCLSAAAASGVASGALEGAAAVITAG